MMIIYVTNTQGPLYHTPLCKDVMSAAVTLWETRPNCSLAKCDIESLTNGCNKQEPLATDM